ncbi:MAG: sialate O-acetylesterase [Planctomycetaceae bacterium]|nr:sialate O-acetylesterase [Planctomycetaceae bacterium]
MSPKNLLLTFGLMLSGLSLSAHADVRLPSIFADHMVLQRDMPILVWGWAEPGETVRVVIEQQEHVAQTDAQGRWEVQLKPLAAGGPVTMTITGSNQITLSDVLVGEVWFCSGQSNMAMTVNRAMNYEQEQQQANVPTIRMFKVGGQYANEPQTEADGNWIICSPETVGGFTATGYFFAKHIQPQLKVPVALINASVGGTPIDSWIPSAAQRGSASLAPLFEELDRGRKEFDKEAALARYEEQLAKWKERAKAARAAGETPPRAPRNPVEQYERKQNVGGLYHGKVAPFIRYGFRGALWYQGEANSTPERAGWYQHQLPLLVDSWRKDHGAGDFPFAWVQLPNFGGAGRNWPVVREGMLDTLYLPHTGMAITIDVGETRDIHPKNKQAVGSRLGTWALASVYGGDGPAMGPIPQEAEAEGKELVVPFTQCGDGLQLADWKPDLTIAAIAGEDQQWQPVDRIEIDGDIVRFSSTKVRSPVALRYLWTNDPQQVPLRNSAGIPASPFRTDAWEGMEPF